MKKIGLLVLGIFCLILTGCGASNESKDVGTIDNFNTIASNNGLSVTDNINSYKDFNYITEATLANTTNVNVEMIIYSDIDSAKKVQDEQIKNFRTIRGTGTTEHKDKGENYYKFWMVSNGYYMVSSRIDNTLIFSKTLLENKEKVEAILDGMNY